MLTVFPVTTTTDSGAGSLRQAITSANNAAGLDTITFNIAGSGAHVIKPLSALPTITSPVIIDGTTQPGYAGSPLIQLEGSMAGTNVTGLYITAGGSTVKGLDITHFLGTGIVLQTGGSNFIANNYLGTDPTGAAAAGNRDDGLAIYGGSPNNQITQNVISANGVGNGFAGVYVADPGSNGNIFAGNFVGTDKTGMTALGNGGVGMYVANGAQNTRIGTNGDGSNDVAERNIISGNAFQGIAVQGTSSGANTTGTIVAGNYIGTNAAGTAALPNGNNGVFVYGGAQNTRIGVNGADPDAVAEMNLISGNAFQGVSLSDSGTSFNIVAGNLIGTDITGTKAVPNSDGGIDIINGTTSNRIGFDGTSSAAVAVLERNVVSGNGSTPGYAGIYVADPGTSQNVIAGNYVGVDSSGTKALGNTGVGVYLANGAQNNRIGTDGNGVADASEANVISGNAYEGVTMQGTTSGANTIGNIVAGNFIGTNAAGSGVLANLTDGIRINTRAQSNRIGTNGTDTDAIGEGNVIAGNAHNGIVISDAGTTSNTVAGNWIGTNPTGATTLGNATNGITMANGAQSNKIGGSATTGNVIAFNSQAGIAVTDSSTTGNSIRANKIYGNGGLGIDLGDSGVQVNHAGPTTGPNNLQNYPLITAGTPGATTTISGVLNSLASTTYTLDFYAGSTPDITFYGPGQRYLGATSVTTNASGTANFSASLNGLTSTGDWVTATATDPFGNTSEFSGDRQLPFTSPTLSLSTWTQLGPNAIAQSPEFSGPVMSGRVESAAPDPTNPNIMYLTSDGGGVWKTTNWLSNSPTWTPLTDTQSSTVTGSGDLAYTPLAVFPGNSSIVFAAAAGPGGGILKSTNGGVSWTLLGASVFDQVAFGSLVVDPNNSNNLFATVRYGPNGNSGGVYKSTNGGVTWTNTTASFHTGAASDVVMDPTNSQVLYAGLTQGAGGGSSNGLYKSNNGGTTWTRLAGGMLTGSAVGASIRVAVAPSAPQTLYATVFDTALGNAPDGLPHRYRSNDGGTTWTSLPALPTNDEYRYWHVVISVDPTQPQTIYVNGDHTVYMSANGGSSWTEVNDFEDPVGGYFDDSGSLVLTGDHGIYRGTNFVNKQGNLGSSEFYTLTLDPTNANIAYGLAQDQFAAIKYTGYAVWNSTGQAPNFQDSAGAGEIGKILVDPTSPNKLYRYAPNDFDANGFILSSTDGGATWTEAGSGIPTALAGYGLGYASQKAFVMDPTNAQRMLVGTNQVYETTNASGSWTAISPVLSPSSNLSDQYITSIAIAPSHPNTIYAATADGRMFVTQNDGGTWTEIDTGLPKDFFDQIVSIQVDPANANRAVIVPGRFPTNVFGSTHVWMTTTGGSSGWTDITGNLPAEDWTNSIAVDWRPATPVLYVGTARGVFQSADLGVTWSQFGASLPNSPVTDLQLVPALNVLAASTYGRGAWEIQIGSVNRVWNGQGSTSNWSDANDWSGHTVPQPGDILVFASAANRLTNTNNLSAGIQFHGISFPSGAGAYTLGGNVIDADGYIANTSANTQTINLPLALTGNETLTAAAGGLKIGGNISETGGHQAIVVAGPGIVTLSGTNTYTGGTTVSSGTLIAASPNSIPAGTNASVGAGATLVADRLILSALVIGGNTGAPGTVTIASSDANGNPFPSAAATPANALPSVTSIVGNSGSAEPPLAGIDLHSDTTDPRASAISGAWAAPALTLTSLSLRLSEAARLPSSVEFIRDHALTSNKLAVLDAAFASSACSESDGRRREWLGAEVQFNGDESPAAELADSLLDPLTAEFWNPHW